MFIERRPFFKSSVGRSQNLIDIMPKAVSLLPSPPLGRLETGYCVDPCIDHRTAFRQIRMIPRSATWKDPVRALLASPPPRRRVSKETYLHKACAVFEKAIEDVWIPDRFHIILHSGGYDSRLISWTIRQLYQKNGADWLGDILFMELEGEPNTLDILIAEGWDKHQFVTYRDDLPIDSAAHHSRACEFENAWRRLNGGVWQSGRNITYEPIEWLQESGRIPADTNKLQGWIGILANDIAHALIGGPGLRWVFEKLLYHVYTLFPTKGDWIFPYLSLDLIRVLYEYGRGQEESQEENWRRHALELFAPDVARFLNPQRGVYPAELRLSDCEQMAIDFRCSWYGRTVAADVIPHRTVVFNRWWGLWGLASLCEELLRRGHTIREP